MVRFLSLEIRGWSVLPYQRLPIHNGITLLVGDNGCGKTTLLDAIRLLLGADRFVGDRTLAGYMKQDVSRVYLVGRLDNALERGRRPLFRIGGVAYDVLTLVARLVRDANGDWKKTYAVHDGEVDANDLDRLKWISPKEYKSQLKKIGISPAVLKIISLSQGATDIILKGKPEDLAEYVLELSGDKEIMENQKETREKLKQARKAYQELERDLRFEMSHLENTRMKRDKWREIQGDQRVLMECLDKLPLAQFYSAEQEHDSNSGKADNFEKGARTEETKVQDNRVKVFRLNTKKAELENQREGLEPLRLDLGDKREAAAVQVAECKKAVEELEAFLKKYEGVTPVSIPELEVRLGNAHQAWEDSGFEYRKLNNRFITIQSEIRRLEREQNISYPEYVERMREQLRAQGIEHVLLAEAVEITASEWRSAIEYLLGRERFTLVVDGTEELLIRAKEIAQSQRYRAYVQSPGQSGRHPVAGSARAVIEVKDERVAGCLDWLNNIFLVDDIRSGHELAKQGRTSITPEAYKQDRRGGISLWPERDQRHFCGRMAFQEQLKSAREKQAELGPKVQAARLAHEKAAGQVAGLEKQIADQNNVRLLPARRAECSEYQKQWQGAAGVLDRLRKAEKHISQRLKSKSKAIENLGTLVARLEEKIKTGENQVRGNLEAARKHRQSALQLKQVMDDLRREMNSEQKSILDDPAQLASLETPEVLESTVNSLRERLMGIDESEYLGIEELCLERESTVEQTGEKLKAQYQTVESHQKEHDEAVRSHIEMVKRVLQEVRNQIREQAEHCQALKAKCDFEMVSIDPPRWSIDLRVAFDGKKFVRYNDPDLSGGQKVITSLLLLIAAIKAEQHTFSFMLLDEPTAHLDLHRMDEVGRFLRSTNAQYIISAPYNANVKHMGWVDMALIMSKKAPDAEYAPPTTYAIAKPDYVARRAGVLF